MASSIYSGGAVVIALVMLVGGIYVLARSPRSTDGTTIRELAIVLFIPTLLMAAAGGFMQGEALSALLGAVAGYVFGRADKNG